MYSARLDTYSAPPQQSPSGGGGGYAGGAPGSRPGAGGFGGPQLDVGASGLATGTNPTVPVPETSFNCADYEYPGYYADVEVDCQVFHICQEDGRHDAFFCPNSESLTHDSIRTVSELL